MRSSMHSAAKVLSTEAASRLGRFSLMKFVVNDMSVKASKLHVARMEMGLKKTALAKLSTGHRTIIATCHIYAHWTLCIHSSQPGNTYYESVK